MMRASRQLYGCVCALLVAAAAMTAVSGRRQRSVVSLISSAVSSVFSPTDSADSCPDIGSPADSGYPVSVHRLRASDVRVVAALGDSITSAVSARSWRPLDTTSYRDVSWSGGMADDALTMPRILRRFSPDLRGAARQTDVPTRPESGLNVGESGARHGDLPGQALRLVQLIGDDPLIDLQRDWKVVTVFIGGNDLCKDCERTLLSVQEAAEEHVQSLRRTLDILEASLPRTFVNLVPVLDLDFLYRVPRSLYCSLVLQVACPCAARRLRPDQMHYWVQQYQRRVLQLAESGRYDSSRNATFAVVLQPFMLHAEPPSVLGGTGGKVDRLWLAPDCFHPSVMGQQLLATMLWNNMVTPVGQKSTDGRDAMQGIKCPHPSAPYFPTKLNPHGTD